MKKRRSRAAAVLCSAALTMTAVTPASLRSSYGLVAVQAADGVVVTEAAGWKESAFCKWQPLAKAEGYHVYADGTRLDDMLIRQYKGYFRADALGLNAGAHTLKIVPVIDGKENSSLAAEQKVTVTAHDRSGFGWVGGTSSGAYNEDGTLKENAVVLYVTEENKDSISCEVQTGSSKTETFTGIQQILNGVKKGAETRPFCIRVIGEITDPKGIADMGGDLALDGGKKYKGGMTLEGVGDDALFSGFGVKIKNFSNLEVRNLGVMLCDSEEGDNITLQQDNDHVWVHNCDSFYGLAGGDADQAKGDGALDCKRSTYITFSYNHFWDNGKCNLLGLKENTTEDLYITYHHNWYDHSDSRHPRVRFYTAHVYNNYYDGVAKYGIGSTQSSSIFAESNYFRNCKYPILTSMQGSDLLTGGTFSGEDGGVVKAYGNYMTGQSSFISYADDNKSYDAYVVSDRKEKVPGTVKALQTSDLGDSYSHTYNNFDTASDMYSYTADDVQKVPSIVQENAGRMLGGDFEFAFTEKDDEDYALNADLMNALKSYSSDLLAIGSGFTEDVPPSTTPSVTTSATSDNPPTVTTTAGSQKPSTPSDEVQVVAAGGWNEMAYLVVSGIADADVTGVSYSGAAKGSLTGEDLEYLVRDTEDGLRVDLLGLPAGTYTVTLTTKKGSIEQGGIAVSAQDRSGFAHFQYDEGVGAYLDDGTLKPGAKVLYVTEENKDTVSVTSKDGTTVKGIGNILNSVGQDTGSGKTSGGGKANTNSDIIKKLAADGTPLVVRIIGNVSTPEGVTAYDSVDYGGSVGDNGNMVRMRSGKDITIEGVGTGAVVNGWGFHFMAESSAPEYGKSFEVRNLAFRNVPEDCIGMEGVQDGDELTAPVERCWIHNCEFYVPKVENPAESDKAEGDGACDFKRGQYFTNSYCYYEGYHKTNLVGASDSNLQFHLTYHHNYWKDCESRGPLARQANIHMYNNVFDGQTSYCMNPRANAYIFSEYNVFKDSKNPMQVKSGAVKSYQDEFTNVRGDQDGTIVTDKNEPVSSGNRYENFDTDSSLCYIPSGDYLLDTESSPDLYTTLKAIFEKDGGTMKYDKVVPSVPPTTGTTTEGGENSEETTTTETVPTDLLGDVDCSTVVNITDAVLLARLASSDAELEVSSQGMRNAEMNQDGAIDDKDVTLLLKVLVGITKS